jgi:geranylgeranyl diphosphate synthase type I
MLGGGSDDLLAALERVGRSAGMAFQLRDDLIGLFGIDAIAGKEGGADFFEGKRTFPVIAAWTRATSSGRERLEALWQNEARSASNLGLARHEVEARGGRAATERVVERMTRTAVKNLDSLPNENGVRDQLDRLLKRMVRRTS